MTRAEQIKTFSREFVNGINRTPERKRLIQDVYYEKFGARLRLNCSMCYIEAIFKILKTMDKPTSKYRLKKGAILQPFGQGIITNDNLTDEIAEESLKTGIGNLGMFSVFPKGAGAEPEIIPAKPVEVPVAKLINDPVKVKVKRTRKSKK